MLDTPHATLEMMLCIVAMTGFGWLPIWFQDRKHTAVFWTMVAGLVLGAGMTGRAFLPFLPGIMVGNGGLLICHALIWTACRSLRKQPPVPWLIILPAATWGGLCLVPEYQDNVNLRILTFTLLSTYLTALAIREVWLINRGSPVIRGWVLGVLSLQGVTMLIWAARMSFQPATQAHAFSAIPNIVPTLFGVTGFILLLGPAIVALDKELSDLQQRAIARNDVMTGVGNRRHFEEALDRLFTRAVRQGSPLSLIMVDADYFKDYNDLYGHPAGDKCLRALAHALRYCCRPSDVVGRYGGEEFAILLPGTDRETAHAIARRMLFKVRELRMEHAGSPGGIVTISIGVGSVHPDDQVLPEDLVELADRALYQAKHGGRNGIRVAGEDYEAVAQPSRAAE